MMKCSRRWFASIFSGRLRQQAYSHLALTMLIATTVILLGASTTLSNIRERDLQLQKNQLEEHTAHTRLAALLAAQVAERQRLAAQVAERERLSRAGARREGTLKSQIESLKSIERGIREREERMRTVTR